jgi:hypothetical protein
MLSDAVGFGPLMYRYWSGLYRKPEHNGASLVVSNGVGNWFPLRTRAPAEIIDLTLRSAAQTADRHDGHRYRRSRVRCAQSVTGGPLLPTTA